MVRPTLKKQIPNLQEAIKDTAWRQIAEQGAAALSLRAIARELKITAPAIYNYFSSRDELVTALIVDAYNSLGDSQQAILESVAKRDGGKRLSALGIAYRDWAVKYPQRYQLIFGTPIPNYHAPEDITLPASVWALTPLIGTIQAIYAEGNLRIERLAKLTPALKFMLETWSQFTGRSADIEVLYVGYIIWTRVHGMMMLELGGQLPSFITDPGEVFRREVENILSQYL